LIEWPKRIEQLELGQYAHLLIKKLWEQEREITVTLH
jgi:hypothetical protein